MGLVALPRRLRRLLHLLLHAVRGHHHVFRVVPAHQLECAIRVHGRRDAYSAGCLLAESLRGRAQGNRAPRLDHDARDVRSVLQLVRLVDRVCDQQRRCKPAKFAGARRRHIGGTLGVWR